MKEISEALGSALIAYLEGEATLLQIESLHEWAGLDPENAELLYGLKHLYAERNATSKIEAVDVETMRHRLLARPEFASEERIAALRPAPRRKLWRKIWFRAVGYAASAAALIAVGVLVGKSGGTVFSDSFNTICVDAGSKSRIVLADGTQVTMKASSKLRYPASFGSGPREVWLDGEAYFDVEHDAEHPFIVHSYRQSVRVLGTTFNVQAYSNESENTVTLLSGAVELDLLSRKGELLRSLELHPYEQCHSTRKPVVTGFRNWTPTSGRFRGTTGSTASATRVSRRSPRVCRTITAFGFFLSTKLRKRSVIRAVSRSRSGSTRCSAS